MTKTTTKPKPARAELLTPLQQAFVHEYAKGDKSATQAAIAAGYSPRTARVQVYSLLRNAGVKAELDRIRERITKKTVYDATAAFNEAGEAMEIARKTNNSHAFTKAVELRSKLHGLLTDKLLVETVSVDLTAALRDAKARVSAAFPPPVRPMRDPAPAIDAEFAALPKPCDAGPIDKQSGVPVLDLAAARSRVDRGAGSEPAAVDPGAAAASRIFE